MLRSAKIARQAQLLCARLAHVVYCACDIVACDAEEKEAAELVNARASKNVKMAEPEVTFHQAEETFA